MLGELAGPTRIILIHASSPFKKTLKKGLKMRPKISLITTQALLL